MVKTEYQLIKEFIERERMKYKKLYIKFARRLTKLSVGPLLEQMSYKETNGKMYYSEIWNEGNVRRSKYLGTRESGRVKEIQEKHFLKRAISEINKAIYDNDAAMKLITEIDFAEINDSLPKVYRLSEDHLKVIVGPDEAEKWFAEASKEKERLDRMNPPKYSSGLKHRLKDGRLVRSKSEKMIGNELIDAGVLFIYEMPTFVGQKLLHPDFSFYSRRRRRIVKWEHIGMLGDPEYMGDFSKRMNTYISCGITPCVDVIFTFDSLNGELDLQMIRRIIEEYA